MAGFILTVVDGISPAFRTPAFRSGQQWVVRVQCVSGPQITPATIAPEHIVRTESRLPVLGLLAALIMALGVMGFVVAQKENTVGALQRRVTTMEARVGDLEDEKKDALQRYAYAVFELCSLDQDDGSPQFDGFEICLKKGRYQKYLGRMNALYERSDFADIDNHGRINP